MNNIIKNHRDFVANQIEKSFDSGISVPQELDIEKAKWKVGDEKQYQGATWVVGGFNAKGTPLWRKKKDGGAPAGGSATSAAASTQTQANQSNASAPTSSVKTDYNSADWKNTEDGVWEIGSLADGCKITVKSIKGSTYAKKMLVKTIRDGKEILMTFDGSGNDSLKNSDITDDFVEKVREGKIKTSEFYMSDLSAAMKFSEKFLNNRSKPKTSKTSKSGKNLIENFSAETGYPSEWVKKHIQKVRHRYGLYDENNEPTDEEAIGVLRKYIESPIDCFDGWLQAQSMKQLLPFVSTPKKRENAESPQDKYFIDVAAKIQYPVGRVKSMVRKIQTKFYLHSLTDKEAVGVIRKYLKSGANSFDSWLENVKTVDALGAKEQTATPAAPQQTASKTPKKDPTEKLIEDFANKVGDSPRLIKHRLWQVHNRFYRYDLTDKEAIGVLRKYYRIKSPGDFDWWIEHVLTRDAIGVNKMVPKK